jgi:hypothetical protein
MPNENFDASEFLDDGDDSDSLINGDSETNDILGIEEHDQQQPYQQETPDPVSTELDPMNDDHVETVDNSGQQQDTQMVPSLNIGSEDDYASLDDLDEFDLSDATGTIDLSQELDAQDDTIQPSNTGEDDDQESEPESSYVIPTIDPIQTPQVTIQDETDMVPPDDDIVPIVQTPPLEEEQPVSIPVESIDRHDDHPIERPSSPPERIEQTQDQELIREEADMDTLNVNTIRKIIVIIGNYRALDDKSKNTVSQFIKSISAIKKRKINQLDEASIIKEIIEIDPDIRLGVNNLLQAKAKTGADRAFFLMGLDAKSLMNIDIFLRMTAIAKTSLVIKDESLSSIKSAAEELNGLIDKLLDNQVVYIKKLDSILQSTKEIMDS